MPTRLLAAALIVGLTLPARAEPAREPAEINVWSSPPPSKPTPAPDSDFVRASPARTDAEQQEDNSLVLMCACGGVGTLLVTGMFLVLLGGLR